MHAYVHMYIYIHKNDQTDYGGAFLFFFNGSYVNIKAF